MLKKKLINWHNALGWWAFAGVLIWSLSAITHPLMSWLGPQSVKFFPPKLTLSANDVNALSNIEYDPNVFEGARVVKLVPGATAPMLQVTRSEDAAREYFHLASLERIEGQDLAQALWLASYYSGLDASAVLTVDFLTDYSSDYPSVNRLLPVYKVSFDDKRNTVAYVYTETGALASLSNGFKKNIQWFFQNFHTFNWLTASEFGRVVIIGLWMLSLSATAVIGFALVLVLKRRKISDAKRRYHRIFAYVLWLPLLAWSTSGFYHLIHASVVDTDSGVRLGETFPMSMNLSIDDKAKKQLALVKVNELALVAGEGNQVFWRASVQPKGEANPMAREKRFAGKPMESQAMYFPLGGNASELQISDKALSLSLAKTFIKSNDARILDVHLVTRFGPHYDFRNKRLPVWKVAVDDDDQTWLFIDPRTGVLVDKSRFVERAERWSFSYLHKWNYLTPFVGRQLRDVLIVFVLLAIVVISILGALLLLKRKKPVSRRPRNAEPAVLLTDQ